MDLTGKRVLVVGMARTGVAAARFLVEKGARVMCTDLRSAEELGPEVRALADSGCLMRFGMPRGEHFLDSDLIVISPGVPMTLKPLQDALAAGIEVVGEVEMASWFLPGPVIGVTGTNGKTTTVSLIHHLLSQAGLPHWVGGNIGRPVADFLLNSSDDRDTEDPQAILAELSSFQLESIARFRPWIAVWTNLSPDHLDRYPDMDAYAEAKARIFMNQTEADYAVVPSSDPWLEKYGENIRARLLRFGAGGDSMPEIQLVPGGIRLCLEEQGSEEFYRTDRVILPGTHNLENMMVALAVARLCGAPPAVLQSAIESFKGLEHRLEYVGEKGGILFYNDSKATTVASVLRALESFDKPILLLAGGKDKGGSYVPLREPLRRHAKRLILFGQAAAKMKQELEGACAIEVVSDLEKAVQCAWRTARPGQVVLLSPACSSFDMFRDYEERGERFKGLVQEILEKGA